MYYIVIDRWRLNTGEAVSYAVRVIHWLIKRRLFAGYSLAKKVSWMDDIGDRTISTLGDVVYMALGKIEMLNIY